MNIAESQMSTNVLIGHLGDVSWFSAVITTIACDLDMSKFPYDQVVDGELSLFITS